MSSARAGNRGGALLARAGLLGALALGGAGPAALSLALATTAPLAAGCARGEAHENLPPPASAAASDTAPTASAAAAPATAALISPPDTPRPDRPSLRATKTPGADPAQWKRIFDTYGHLLDVDYLLDDHHRRHPTKTRLVTLGTTHQGRAVRALLIADDPEKARTRPAVLLNGAHHGDEPLSAEIVMDAIETLLSRSDSDPRVRRYLAELAIWCVPMVNPDGFAAFMTDFGAGRKNGRETRPNGAHKPLPTKGVDLNRNYPFGWATLKERGGRSDPDHRFYRGPEPGSEPEVRAMMALSDSERFVASISYHIGTVALLAPYTNDLVESPAPNEAWTVAEDIARKMPKNPDKPLFVRKNLYPVDGTDQDHFRGTAGTLALLWEASSRSWETAYLKDRTLTNMRPSWGLLFDRYLDGPSVEGHVRDAAGEPVVADVAVVEVKARAGESWTSRCSDGFFGRFLPGPGRFTVRVTPRGAPPIEKAVEVTREKGRVVVDFVVESASAAAGSPAPPPSCPDPG